MHQFIEIHPGHSTHTHTAKGAQRIVGPFKRQTVTYRDALPKLEARRSACKPSDSGATPVVLEADIAEHQAVTVIVDSDSHSNIEKVTQIVIDRN